MYLTKRKISVTETTSNRVPLMMMTGHVHPGKFWNWGSRWVPNRLEDSFRNKEEDHHALDTGHSGIVATRRDNLTNADVLHLFSAITNFHWTYKYRIDSESSHDSKSDEHAPQVYGEKKTFASEPLRKRSHDISWLPEESIEHFFR